jgi:hypothetical protein
MTTGEAAYFGLIIAAFLALIVTLAWASWSSGNSGNSAKTDPIRDSPPIGGASSGLHD